MLQETRPVAPNAPAAHSPHAGMRPPMPRGGKPAPTANAASRVIAPAPVAPCDKPPNKHDVPGLKRIDMGVWAVVAFASVALAVVPLLLTVVGVAVAPMAACAVGMVVALVVGGLFLMLRDAHRRRLARREILDRRPPVRGQGP